MRTIKSDWFNDLLSTKEGMFVSGHSSFSNKLGIDLFNPICAFRFVGYQGKFLWLLTIEASSIYWQDIMDFLYCSPTYYDIQEIFQNKLHVNIFSDEKDRFMFDGNIMNNIELQNAYETHLNGVTKNAGTIKEINKTTADNLHDWHRTYLSKYCVANDFDAIQLRKNEIISYELKRVREDINTWMPYLDDYSNYSRLHSISELLGFKIYIISYQIENTDKIAIHDEIILDRNYISGKRTIGDVKIGSYEHDTEKKYTSINKRI